METIGSISTLSDDRIGNAIYEIRGQRVMLDSDIAELYGVATKRVNEQVKRNLGNFPLDFMFQLTPDEWQILKSQFATSSWGGRRKLPYVFTEHGVLMVANILNSERAIQVSIQIVRIFIKIRQYFADNQALKLDMAAMRKRLDSHEKSIELVLGCIDGLMIKPREPRKRIGFKPDSLD